jgi:hypothetical protein
MLELDFKHWCKMNRLPYMSADELLDMGYNVIDDEQRDYLKAFLELWNKVENDYHNAN